MPSACYYSKVVNRHSDTTVQTNVTSGFSTRSLDALTSLSSQHLLVLDCETPVPVVPHFVCTLFTSCSDQLPRQTCYLPSCTSEQLSCTKSSLDPQGNMEIAGWNRSCLVQAFGKAWRDSHTSPEHHKY